MLMARRAASIAQVQFTPCPTGLHSSQSVVSRLAASRKLSSLVKQYALPSTGKNWRRESSQTAFTSEPS